ncbi:hypothetical protein CPC16_001770 [Podila verticillata]|nr:hypothetical protein CPC16_001770 [Podila verticillata]
MPNFPVEGTCIAECTNIISKIHFLLYDYVKSEGPFFFVSLSYSHEYGPEAPENAENFRTVTQICTLCCRIDRMVIYRENKSTWFPVRRLRRL